MEDAWTVLKDHHKLHVAKIDSLVYESGDLIEKIFKKTKRLLFWKFKRQLNLFSSELILDQFLEKKIPNIAIEYIDSLVGYGVFAQEKIPAFAFLGEYVGLVRKRTPKIDSNNDYIFRYLTVGFFQSLIIDAETMGNFTRFINHSSNPNLSSRFIVHEGQYHIVFITNRRIEKGEQLTYDYGPTYWSGRASPLEF